MSESYARPHRWVIGAGGLLGGAICRAAAERGEAPFTHRVTWDSRESALASLTAGLQGFRRIRNGRRLEILWCAGSGVTSSGQAHLEQEISVLSEFLESLANHLSPEELASLTLFYPSSVGGVYGGSTDAPITEVSATQAISPYGEAKLRAENIVRRFAHAHSVRVFIGRLSNLYGAGQDMRKGQGLISVLLQKNLERNATTIFMPLDTLRDYIYVDDAAALILDCVDRCATASSSQTVTKIIAANSPTSIASILGAVRTELKRRPLVVMASTPQASMQARNLTVQSVVWPDLDQRHLTSLPVGIMKMRRTLRS
ncbi:SDR family oxidoreductase [Microbacterium capsulatum]|uniref:SDR family oxidoreductase n=1 Tax=Microbacterium capsulatum TaxID=3041921 RepID=A0ABU0XJS9_9MICO|nr:SDR family oxidoreductase [Microbacterium sp. ASV81]MDQ4215383.1 SDR family oxidoreductase [Microbacterium sp. ASV81]